MITAIAWRQDAKGLPCPGRTIQNVTLALGHSPLLPHAMSTTFAANHGSPPTTVASGAFQLPSLPPATGVAAFAVRLPFAVPFTLGPGAGSLLLDLTVGSSGSSITAPYELDAVRSPQAQGSVDLLGSPGTGAGVVYTMVASFGASAVQFSAGVQGRAPATSHLILGASASWSAGLPLPLDLAPFGAPGSTLRVHPLIVLPLAMTPTTPTLHQGVANVPLPAGLPPHAVFYGQGLITDPLANPLGLVLSPASALQLPGIGAITQTLISTNPTAASGTFLEHALSPVGAVVELTGVFQ